MGITHARGSGQDSLSRNGVTRTIVDGTRQPLTGFRELWARQRKTLSCFLLALLLLAWRIQAPASSEALQSTGNRPGNLHLLIPASRGDPNLCKVLLSAAILGYPSPVLINFGEVYDDPGLVAGGSHLAKINGVHSYLASLDETHDQDLLLLVDGYDVWFQLRPDVLVKRFDQINQQANRRIQSELGRAAMQHNICQEIVFGCQKRCWPWTFDDPPCYAVPNSSLPTNVYGNRTDTASGDESSPYDNYRQRFLNSGVAMGTIRAMRKLFQQALKQAEKERNFGSDQYILSHIYGDQEIYREIVRRDSLSLLRRLRRLLGKQDVDGKDFPERHVKEVRAKAGAREDKNFEFSLGVDYASSIGLNTVFAEDDTEWLRFNDLTLLRQVQELRGIDAAAGNLQSIQPDIAQSLPPFWTFTVEQDLARWTDWVEVNLFTNVWTGITPAIIHHNAHKNGMKSLRETFWNKTFFFDHARTLLDAHIYAPVIPVAISGTDATDMREWWPREIWKGGARRAISSLGTSGDDNWIRFDDICRPYHEEIFRDGKGPWELPQVH